MSVAETFDVPRAMSRPDGVSTSMTSPLPKLPSTFLMPEANRLAPAPMLSSAARLITMEPWLTATPEIHRASAGNRGRAGGMRVPAGSPLMHPVMTPGVRALAMCDSMPL